MRIAIVGSGVSGLVCAHLLHADHDIAVFEADPRVGGHAHTVDVRCDGESLAVDTGFIVYNERNYPGFVRLLGRLGVATQPSDMSFGVRCERSGLEYASRGLRAVFAQRGNLLRPSFHRMLRDVTRWNREARRLLETEDEKLTLREHVLASGYSREFREQYLVPLGAAIWSACPDELLDFPAARFVRFFDNHGLLDRGRRVPWRTVSGGSRRYVEALLAPFRERVHTGRAVVAVRRLADAVEVLAGGQAERFDRAILAVHSDQALRLLADPSDAERRVLSAIRYQENLALLHTDASLMPRSRRAWASWNYAAGREAGERVVVTYHMNRLQQLRARCDYFVSLNAADRVDPSRVLGRFVYHHPVFDARAIAAQKLHGAIDGRRRTHFCGAYWGYGFHEDGIQSALAVCRRLGAEF